MTQSSTITRIDKMAKIQALSRAIAVARHMHFRRPTATRLLAVQNLERQRTELLRTMPLRVV